MNDDEITKMLHHLKSLHFTYRQITASCGFAKTKITNYFIDNGKRPVRCRFTPEEKARLVEFYQKACKLAGVDNALIRHKHGVSDDR